MDHVKKALEVFSNKYHCSQAVLAAFSEELGMDEKTALKLGGCFGGGMCKGEVCGAVTGALMAIGLKYGQCNTEDLISRKLTNDKTNEMLELFQQKNGSYLCKDLLGYNIADTEELKIIREKELFTEFCPRMVESATRIAEEIMNN
jgi:C_GCAxxG_C_C family probable redox protein